jgi:tetratricopeptide (TPR) repeat protein
LNTTLSEKERSLFDSKPTANLQAYDFYLRGNKYAESYWEYNKLDEVPQAVRMYEQAIRIDTKFTASYNALIDLYLDIYWNKPFLNTDDYLKKAKEWLDKLQELNIDDVYSHKAMAAYKYKGQRDYEGALFELDVVDEKMGNGKSTYQLRAEILIRKGKIDEAIHYLSMQTELFPRVARYWAGMAETYKLKRNFDSAVACINRAIELSPDVPAYYTFKSMYYAELKGDIASATSVLKNAAYFVDTSGFRPDFIYFETLKGNYDYVIQLTLPNSGGIGLLWQYSVMPDDINLALMYQAKGKNQEAAHYFKKGYDLLLPLVNKYPDDFRLHASLGIALAGLGKKQEALKEGFRARDLMPPSKDVILAVSPLESLAQIYTLIGEDDEAIDILQQLLKMPFSWTMSNSIPLYRMYYSWKLLHSNARFRALLEDV